MDYQTLSQDEQDDIIVAFLRSQERDVFCHQLNMERYDAMLLTLPEGEWKSRIHKLRNETAQRLAEVGSIKEATKAQLPPQARIDAALIRLAAKEA